MTQARELTIVGHPAPRVEGFEKVTGSAKYVADIPAPGALAGKILRSPYAHARILRIDTSKASATGSPAIYSSSIKSSRASITNKPKLLTVPMVPASHGSKGRWSSAPGGAGEPGSDARG